VSPGALNVRGRALGRFHQPLDGGEGVSDALLDPAGVVALSVQEDSHRRGAAVTVDIEGTVIVVRPPEPHSRCRRSRSTRNHASPSRVVPFMFATTRTASFPVGSALVIAGKWRGRWLMSLR
jgi:hypothetical protein